MHDWKTVVRQNLSPLPLSNERAEDVIEEIAQQLEAAYNEARGQGATEEQAVAEAYRQMGDWEKLRSRVFQSVEGSLLPIWQQRGVFAPRRFPVWIALALALAFLAIRGFRQAVEMLPVPTIDWERPARRLVVSDTDLSRLERAGDKERYARALAFVALHSYDNQRATNAAEKAIALDPALTWIAAPVSHAMEPIPGRDPQPWIDRLRAWDSDNAYPYMLEASALIAANRQPTIWKIGSTAFGNTLGANSKWLSAMDKASRATRVDFYLDREFALDRQVLEDEGCDRPARLLRAAFEGRAFPDVVEIDAYLRVLLDEARAAGQSGNKEEALEKYWRTVSFAEEIGAASSSPLGYSKYRKDAFQSMLPLLAKAGRLNEATAVRAILSTDDKSTDTATQDYKERLRASSRSAQMVFASAICFEFLGPATAAWLFLAAVLKWKPSFSRALNWVASGLSFAPPAFAVASFALFLSYFPYARSISTITSQRDLATTYVPLMVRFSTFVTSPATEVWITRMFWPSIGCLAVAVAGVLLIRRQQNRRAMLDI